MPEFTTEALIASMQEATDDLKARVADLLSEKTAALQADHVAQMPRSGLRKRARPLADQVRIVTLNAMRQVVQSRAPHLHLVERGTAPRYAVSRNGVALKSRAFRGFVPRPAHERFVSMAVSRRAEFLTAAETLIGDREV